jgi:YVTN family beta-propeller protein
VAGSVVAVRALGVAGGCCNTGSDSLSVLDTGINTVAATIALPAGSHPVRVATSRDCRFLYVADSGSDRVSIADTRTNRVVASVPVGL